MMITRIALLVVAIAGVIIALDENSIIFKVVSFAWAGFGATSWPDYAVLVVLEEDDTGRSYRRHANRCGNGIYMETVA